MQLRLLGGRFGSNNGDGRHTFSHPLYLALREQNTVFSGLTGQYIDQASLVGDERSERVRLGLVAGNYFQVLGVRSHLGRLLTPEDDKLRNGHPVAVLQYNFWRNRFQGRQDIVDSTIRLNGAPFTVIGVAAPDFEGTDVVRLLPYDPANMSLSASPDTRVLVFTTGITAIRLQDADTIQAYVKSAMGKARSTPKYRPKVDPRNRFPSLQH